jgi:hypothetical protein
MRFSVGLCDQSKSGARFQGSACRWEVKGSVGIEGLEPLIGDPREMFQRYRRTGLLLDANLLLLYVVGLLLRAEMVSLC